MVSASQHMPHAVARFPAEYFAEVLQVFVASLCAAFFPFYYILMCGQLYRIGFNGLDGQVKDQFPVLRLCSRNYCREPLHATHVI